MALFGSDLEREIKKHAAKTEQAFVGAGQQVGLQVWRINRFHLEPVPQPFTGFYSGDSYIILRTYQRIPEEAGSLRHDIHFWLGQTTTVDEAGTAAYKTVELDELLDQEPVEHREVQNYESQQFLDYFQEFGGFRVLDGGYDSGFRHVEPAKFTTRLLRLCDRNQYTLIEVPFDIDQLNTTSVFFLDTGALLYQWHGKHSNAFGRNRAAMMARAIDVERNGGVKVVVVDEGYEPNDFWDCFPTVTTKSVRALVAPSKRVRGQPNGFWLLNVNTFDKIADQVQSDDTVVFDSNHVVVYDAGDRVWVWVGTTAFSHLLVEEATKCRRNALALGQDYLKQVGRPSSIQISVVKQGYDDAMWGR